MNDFIKKLDDFDVNYSVEEKAVIIHGDFCAFDWEMDQFPATMIVTGRFWIRNEREIKLPRTLVAKSFNIRGAKVDMLPENLIVSEYVYLDPMNIKNIAYHENCGEKGRTIFALFVNGKVQIAAGCFLGDYNEFCNAVDRKYSGDAARIYKEQALDCIDRLFKILKSQ